MQQWMLIFVNQFGYLGIFLLILIENIFPPIPSEAVLLFGGALTVTTAMNVPGTILAATAGSVLGAIVLYAFGRIFQAERLKRLFAGRFGQITKLRPEHVEKAESWFRRYQGKAVLICRCIPIVRSLISIPAGFAKMPMPGFLLLTTLGSAVWNTVLVCIGAMAIVGSFDEGLRGDRTVVFSKAVMDGFAALALASAYGLGVAFAAVPLLLYQGLLVIGAGFLKPWMSPALMNELTATGGVLILGIAFNLLNLTQIRLSNLLPSLLVVVVLALIFLPA